MNLNLLVELVTGFAPYFVVLFFNSSCIEDREILHLLIYFLVVSSTLTLRFK